MAKQYVGGAKVALNPKTQGINVVTFKDMNDLVDWINENITAISGKQSTLTADQLLVVNGNVYDTASKTKLDGIDLTKYYLKTETLSKIEIETITNGLAKLDLSNVKVPAGNEGKFLQVKDDLSLEYVDAPSGGGSDWIEVTDLWADPHSFDKYKDKEMRVQVFAGQYVYITFKQRVAYGGVFLSSNTCRPAMLHLYDPGIIDLYKAGDTAGDPAKFKVISVEVK